MNLRDLAKPATYWRKLGDVVWSTGPDVPPLLTPPSWHVSTEFRDRVEVSWPAEHSWPTSQKWGSQLVAGLSRHVRVKHDDIPQPYPGVIVFKVKEGKRNLLVGFEYSDYSELNEDAYEATGLHFKLQYKRDSYGDRPRLLPGGYCTGELTLHKYLYWLRQLQDRSAPAFDVYGRFGLRRDVRARAIDLLQHSTQFRYHGADGLVGYRQSLIEAARSRVCVDLPGFGVFTFRMVDYLAIGACIICPAHSNEMHVPLVDREHIVFCRADYSDLEELCAYYVKNDAARREIQRAARSYFDRYLHREVWALYYLGHIERVLSS